MDYHIDVKNKILGRVASDISLILQGRRVRATPEPRERRPRVREKREGHCRYGQQARRQGYYRRTGYVGHLKELRLEEKLAKDPPSVLVSPSARCLPKNFLNQKRLKNLIFVADEK